MRALLQVCAPGEADEFECAGGLQDPMLKVSLGARFALLFAAVLLMNAQPAFWESLATVAFEVGEGRRFGEFSELALDCANAGISFARDLGAARL